MDVWTARYAQLKHPLKSPSTTWTLCRPNPLDGLLHFMRWSFIHNLLPYNAGQGLLV